MKPVWIFDLDNTLYSADSGIFQQVHILMGKFVSKHLNIEINEAKELQKKYYKEQIDEIIYLDCVASLYNRSHLIDLLPKVSEQVFVPICAGGGIKNFDNAKKLFDNGVWFRQCNCDKVQK